MTMHPTSQPGQGNDKKARLSWRNSGPLWFWLLLTVAMLAFNGWFYTPHQRQRANLSYTAFLEQVRAGNVSQVEMVGQEIQGQLKLAVPWQPDSKSTAAQHGTFTTSLPPIDDTRLLPLLEEKGVAVTARPPSNPWFLSLLLNALPFLLLVGLMYMSGRRMQQAQGGIFGFGQSKARVYDEERPRVTFADVAGEDQAKLEMAEIVDFLKNPTKYHRLGGRIPRGVLLVGPPGTGKTLLARAVAGEAGVPFFTISASEFVEMFVGVGASRVRDLFQKAKASAPSIMFVDELDAVGRERGAGMGGGNDEREQTLNQLLVEMDGFDPRTEVIVVAATNRPDVLDPALLRPGRFDRQIVVGLPDREGREGILHIHAKGMPLAPDVDLGVLARETPGFAGADLANLCNEAALMAARHNQEQVTMARFQEAVDNIMLGSERSLLMDEDERRAVAYHEAGHALAASLLPGADAVHRMTIMPRGRSLGATAQLPEDDHFNYRRDDLLTRLVVLMGGRAAEEIVIGQVSTGAENDLQQATRLAQGMVARWGMSEALGPVGYRVGETHPFLGREPALQREYSEATAAQIDQEVRRMLQEAHRQAHDLEHEHCEQLDRLAAALLQEETLNAARVKAILMGAA